jgi:hypothetical protein
MSLFVVVMTDTESYSSYCPLKGVGVGQISGAWLARTACLAVFLSPQQENFTWEHVVNHRRY